MSRGARGRIFAISQQFTIILVICTKMGKCEIDDFLADFSFLGENQVFRENGGIAKTSIIPKEYQWFWRVDGPENAKFSKITENLEIL